jgi:uncharacterized membrane protein affecting hemolysin expression
MSLDSFRAKNEKQIDKNITKVKVIVILTLVIGFILGGVITYYFVSTVN